MEGDFEQRCPGEIVEPVAACSIPRSPGPTRRDHRGGRRGRLGGASYTQTTGTTTNAGTLQTTSVVAINGGTLTSSNGSSEILAGHDVTVIGATTAGGSPIAVRRPIITTTPRIIQVITGTRQVAAGSIFVPEVSFVTTTTTEQVGTENVRVGSSFNTADVTLTQTGYYKSTAATEARQAGPHHARRREAVQHQVHASADLGHFARKAGVSRAQGGKRPQPTHQTPQLQLQLGATTAHRRIGGF